ncbi:MAG: hypothetical protein IPJ11_09755 [Gemmatimonadetes bacterium]|nr:hypothetical protein [Gemmatimonadota bacterium]
MGEHLKNAAKRAHRSAPRKPFRKRARRAPREAAGRWRGGREHALALALLQDDPSNQIYVAPGNPGTAAFATNLPIAADDIDRLADATDAHAIDSAVVGPERCRWRSGWRTGSAPRGASSSARWRPPPRSSRRRRSPRM